MMAIAHAASASFTSPIAHAAYIMVMGPGGYRFTDYLKLGVPLTLGSCSRSRSRCPSSGHSTRPGESPGADPGLSRSGPHPSAMGGIIRILNGASL